MEATDCQFLLAQFGGSGFRSNQSVEQLDDGIRPRPACDPGHQPGQGKLLCAGPRRSVLGNYPGSCKSYSVLAVLDGKANLTQWTTKPATSRNPRRHDRRRPVAKSQTGKKEPTK